MAGRSTQRVPGSAPWREVRVNLSESTNARLIGKVAVITGSTGGIGEGIACRLAAEGAAAVVSGRRAEVGEQTAQGIRDGGGQAVFVRADITVEADCGDLMMVIIGS